MLCVVSPVRERESGSLEIMKTIAIAVIPELGLELQDILMALTSVETQQRALQIMATNASKPWDTSWCSKMKLT